LQIEERAAGGRDVAGGIGRAGPATVRLLRRIGRGARGPAGAPPEAVVLTCYSKPGCTLCDKAKGPVARAARGWGLPVTVAWVDILGDPALVARWGERIPVVTVAAGAGEVVLAEGKVSELRLRRALDAYLRDARAREAGDGR
jgi:hypothetical protein